MMDALEVTSAAHRLWLVSFLLPFATGIGLALWPRRWDSVAKNLALPALSLSALALTASLVLLPANGDFATIWRQTWIPALGLDLLIARDGLSAMFAILVSWIAVTVVLFARRYLPHANDHEHSQRSESAFYALMCLFTGSMLGVVSAGNLLQLYLFWEATGLASYMLIGYWAHHAEAREGAFRAWAITVAGGVAMLVGFLLLGTNMNHWSLSALVNGNAPNGILLEITTILILIGALAKSAQFPFSSWLPGAMIAPTPVSAFLHSSALVAAGVYLIARFFPLLHTAVAWEYLLVVPGVAGVAYIGLLAVRQTKIKALLAYSTISQYAFMFIGFGLATVTGVKAALYAFFVHSFIKAGLFLVAGSVTYLTGLKELDQVGGMGRTHKVLAVGGFLLGLSLGGVPIMGGFYYKEELLYAAMENRSWVLFGAMLLGGLFSLLYMLRFLNQIFFGPGDDGVGMPLPRTMAAPMILLAGAALLTSLFPNWMNTQIINPAIAGTLRHPEPMAVELEFSFILFASLLVISLGLVLWIFWKRGHVPYKLWTRIPLHFHMGGNYAVKAYFGLSRMALSVHGGSLGFYLRWVLGILVVKTAIVWYLAPFPEAYPSAIPWLGESTLLLAGVCVLSVASLFLKHHLALAMLLSVLGFMLSGVFVLMKAPNVAIAQVLVETLATVSIVLALILSTKVDPIKSTMEFEGMRNLKKWGIALGVGVILGAGTYFAGGAFPDNGVGPELANLSLSVAKPDFVAAILTDFRSLDTVIEIVIFGTATMAAAGLFWKRKRAR